MTEQTSAAERQDGPAPLRVLFVCTANICRSAFAEVMTRQRSVPAALEVGSAGVHGWRRHPVERYMAEELLRRGLDPSQFRSRKLEPEMVDAADVVIGMEASHGKDVLKTRPEAVDRTFSLGQLARGIGAMPAPADDLDELLIEVRRHQPSANRDDDVVDPYGRGAEAAQYAAYHLERLLSTVVPALLAVRHSPGVSPPPQP
jgi:protein-tyrosine-phosphatase